MIAASGDSGSEDCLLTDNTTQLAVDDPGSQPYVISGGGTTMPTPSASSQVVWNDCQGYGFCVMTSPTPRMAPAAGGQSDTWPKPSYQPNLTSGYAANKRAVPDITGSADPAHGVPIFFAPFGGWTTFGGTSIVAPTNAGFFVGHQPGLLPVARRGGPGALRRGELASNYFDVTVNNNDLTNTNGGAYPATLNFDAASGLGSPIDQNLYKALQGGDGTGCPSVAAVSPNTGPLSGSGAITISGGGFQNATSVNVRVRGRWPDRLDVRHLHHRDPAQRGRPDLRRHHGAQRPGHLGDHDGRPLRLRR